MKVVFKVENSALSCIVSVWWYWCCHICAAY